MSSVPQPGVTASSTRHSRLRTLVADSERFAAEFWGRGPLFSSAAELPGDARALFSAAAVDELVSTRGLRTPFLRMAREGATLPDRAFTASGGVGASITDQLSDDKLLRQFADGATMVLQGLHRTWEPLILFAQGLTAELGHPVQVNGYVTPPQSRGFDDHYDVHDVFVLQVAGTKHWRVRPPVHPHPLRDQPWTDHRGAVAKAAETAPELDVVLTPGDTLYLPRGWLHSATAMGSVSTHLTMGVHTWTRFHLLEQLVAEAVAELGSDVDVRSSLPVGTDVSDPRELTDDLELVRARLLRAVQDVPGEALARRLAEVAGAAQRPEPIRPLAQLAAADALTEDARLRLREHLAARFTEHADGTVVVHSRVGDLDLTHEDATRAADLLRGKPVAVTELGVALARRLLLAGIAVNDSCAHPRAQQ